MPNFAVLFKQEVARLARKEVRTLTGATRKAASQHRRDIADLKREVTALRRKVLLLEEQEKRRLASPASTRRTRRGGRFSAGWLASHRKRLGLSALDYGRLVGVSGVTIYSWEAAKTRPREKQLARWLEIRELGKREAERRLELMQA